MQPLFRGILPLCALTLFLAPTALPQEGESVRGIQVQAVLERCKGAGAADIWRFSDELIALGAPAKRTIQEAVKGAGPEGKLAALRALIELDSPTFAAERLMEMAESEELAIEPRLIALELVGLTEEPDAEDGLLELLVGLNPKIRLAAARALWRLDAPRSHRAKTVLREFLKSADADLRAEGALALAEIGDAETPGVTEVLQELRRARGTGGNWPTPSTTASSSSGPYRSSRPRRTPPASRAPRAPGSISTRSSCFSGRSTTAATPWTRTNCAPARPTACSISWRMPTRPS